MKYHEMPSSNKVVQTILTTEEYKALIETLSRKHLSIQDGLRVAIIKLIEEENIPSSADSFFKIEAPSKGSGLSDLSVNHDKYLYRGEKKEVKKS